MTLWGAGGLLAGAATLGHTLTLHAPADGALLPADRPVVIELDGAEVPAPEHLLVVLDDGARPLERAERSDYILQVAAGGPPALAAVLPGDARALPLGRLAPGEHSVRIQPVDRQFSPAGPPLQLRLRLR